MDYLDNVNQKNADRQSQLEKEYLQKQLIASNKLNTDELIHELREARLNKYLSDLESGNSNRNKILLANGIEAEDLLAPLTQKIDDALRALVLSKEKDTNPNLVGEIQKTFSELKGSLGDFLSQQNKVTEDTLEAMQEAIANIQVNPLVEVSSPEVHVPQMDIQPLLDQTEALKDLIKTVQTPTVDNEAVVLSIMQVRESIEALRFPVPNYVLPFKDASGAATQANVDAYNNVAVTPAIFTERYDYASPTTIYTAAAPVGTADSDPVWTVFKYDLANTANASGKVAYNLAWTNRTSGVYQ